MKFPSSCIFKATCVVPFYAHDTLNLLKDKAILLNLPLTKTKGRTWLTYSVDRGVDTGLCYITSYDSTRELVYFSTGTPFGFLIESDLLVEVHLLSVGSAH